MNAADSKRGHSCFSARYLSSPVTYMLGSWVVNNIDNRQLGCEGYADPVVNVKVIL